MNNNIVFAYILILATLLVVACPATIDRRPSKSGGAQAADSLKEGLVNEFLFDNTVEDSGSAKAAVQVVGRQYGKGHDDKNSNAFYLDGGTSSFVVDGEFAFHSSKEASFSIWVKPENSLHKTIVWTRGDSVDSSRYNLYHDGGNILFDYRDKNGVVHNIFEEPVDYLNRWTHIVVTKSDNYYTIYIDGKRAQVHIDGNPNLPAGPAQWGVGNRADAAMKGYVDDLRVYNRALTAADVTMLYNK